MRGLVGGILAGLALCSVARADCGSVPFYAPTMGAIDIIMPDSAPGGVSAPVAPTVQFDPLEVSVFEPKQRAIILWNGEEEVLLLSTDQAATRPAPILEVIPLPSEPKVELGKFETFQAAQSLVIKKGMWTFAHGGARADLVKSDTPPAARITFQGKLGAHNLAVAEVLNRDGFVQYVQRFLQAKYGVKDAPIRPEFVKIIESYLKEDYRWFAFDVISLTDKPLSREPIQYRFKCDHVFYPLRISSLEVGKTNVDLLVFSGAGATRFQGIPQRQLDMTPTMDVTPAELKVVNPKWDGFFKKDIAGLKMDRWRIDNKKSSELALDVKVK